MIMIRRGATNKTRVRGRVCAPRRVADEQRADFGDGHVEQVTRAVDGLDGVVRLRKNVKK